MKIQNIGNYTIMKSQHFKQIYNNQTNKMLQITPFNIYYLDLNKMNVIKRLRRVLRDEKAISFSRFEREPMPKPPKLDKYI